jgi:hypothetical protein
LAAKTFCVSSIIMPVYEFRLALLCLII